MGKFIMVFTLDSDVAEKLDEIPKGQKSAVVNEILRKVLKV